MVAVEQRHLNAKPSIVNISAKVENDRREIVRKLALDHGVSTKTIHGTLHKEKLARWLPKLTDKEIKKERARTCKTFVGAVP